MTHRSTPRLLVALGTSMAGLLLGVVAGIPEAALLAAPWAVLTILGLSTPLRSGIMVRIEAREQRAVVGETVKLDAIFEAAIDGLGTLVPAPHPSFWSFGGAEDSRATYETDVVHAGAPTRMTIELPAEQWGTYDLGMVDANLLHPYGLVRTVGSVRYPSVVRVHPTPVQLRELLAPHSVRRSTGTHRSKLSGRGVEYSDLRPYSAGDSLRDINWRASARSTELWVSERHPDHATDVVLLLDSFVESGHDVRQVFGIAIEAAIALAEGHLGVSDRVGVIEFGGVVRWLELGTGRRQLQRIADTLLATGLYANAANKPLPVLPTNVLPPRSLVVALTGLLDHRFIEALISARQRGHDVAVIECVVEAAEGSEAGPVSRVATRLWEAERMVVKHQLAEKGVLLAEWRAGDRLETALMELTRRRRWGRVRVR